MNTENSHITKLLFAMYVSKHKLQRILFLHKNQTSVVNSSLVWIENYFMLLVKSKIVQEKRLNRSRIYKERQKIWMFSTKDMGKVGE